MNSLNIFTFVVLRGKMQQGRQQNRDQFEDVCSDREKNAREIEGELKQLYYLSPYSRSKLQVLLQLQATPKD